MTNRIPRRTPVALKALAAALALCCLPALGGCSFFGASPDAQMPTQQPLSLGCLTNGDEPLSLIIGAHANEPAPQLPQQILTLVNDAAVGQQPVSVYRLDGAPSLAYSQPFKPPSNNNPQIYNQDLRKYVSSVTSYVSGLTPKTAQSDPLTALSTAARQTPAGGTVVMVDSGLPTIGPLSYQNSNMFGADPDEVAGFLQTSGLLPQLTGESVVFAGLGQTLAPQPALPQNDQTQLAAMWQAIAVKGGAKCVYSLTAALATQPLSATVPVAVVTPPAPISFPSCGTTVLGDAGSVGFVVGTSTFRDPTAANATLQQLANDLLGHDQQVQLIGSTSSEGDPQQNITLSLQRAEAVKSVLVGMGVDASRITAVGDGSNGPNHIPDIDSNGALIPAAAEQNRSVTVVISCAG